MDITNIPEEFLDLAEEEILEYLRVHRDEWENKTEDEVNAFKEDMEMILFNTDIKFLTRKDCTDFINDSAEIFCIVDYVAGMDEEFGGNLDKSLISQFNRCWYYTGMEMIRYEWDELMEKFLVENESDTETDTEDLE